ncbi:putative Chloride channel protein k [Rhodotorula toruloides ATCC 204091]|uniref:BY PROTMAP: gi/342319105/gb/EGU11056.1/ putative Chloride channel protein k [Rhodotorula glutinis ATCC 204091] n=1 Tax=Rhodotorula toruloides TaxID=5286 RepID=A0A0K3CBA5_RHOTO|nr:putative Chloride channel protein k [Rhodotorula toruloides ATCC 204091]
MQPRDTAQKNGGVAQQPQKQPQQQEVRIQCPYTASSCPLFNPTFSVAEVLAAGSSAPPPPPSPPPKKQPTPLVPLAPPTHPSLVDSMRSACGVGVGAGGMEGEGAAGFAYTDYSIAPSPETLTRSLGSSTSGSGRGSGSPPSLSGSALYAPPPTAPTSYPPKHSPSTYTPLPFNTPSGFRLPSPETPFSPLSALEAAAFASGGAYNTYPSPRPGFGSFGTGSYGGPMSPYLNASGSTSYRPNFDSAILPPPPLPPSHSRTQQPSSCPIGLGFSAPSLDASGLPMPMPVSDLAGLEGLEGLADDDEERKVEGGETEAEVEEEDTVEVREREEPREMVDELGGRRLIARRVDNVLEERKEEPLVMSVAAPVASAGGVSETTGVEAKNGRRLAGSVESWRARRRWRLLEGW